MALVSFPSWMEQPLALTNLQSVDPVIRTSMEIGDKTRRQYTAIRFTASIQLKAMSGERLENFWAWWQHKINCGADWFEIDLRLGDTVNTEEVRLKDKPSTSKLSNDQYLVTMPVEIRTHSIPSESAYDSYASAQ